jgi:hypothetical protein
MYLRMLEPNLAAKMLTIHLIRQAAMHEKMVQTFARSTHYTYYGSTPSQKALAYVKKELPNYSKV